MAENGAEIARAYVLVVPSTQGAQKSLTKELVPEAEAASHEAGTKGGAAFKSALTTAAKATAAAMAAAVAGAAALIKSSLDAYANTEQLAGGIEKLFGTDAANTVLTNAADAYRTAGMSANDYMQQVTGISAALLKSGISAEEAAIKADEAMRQIADNANTFGRLSAEELGNVYSALARGSFQVLDQLSLGYGGTRAGLTQLVRDANAYAKATGRAADLTVDSFADIVTAIGLIQEKQGIANTTVMEAEHTISGSLTMLSASWRNFIAGLGDPNADLDKLIENVMSSLDAAASNIIPAVDRIAKSLIKALPDMVKKVADWLPTALPTVLEAIVTLATSVAEQLPGILETLITVLTDNSEMLIGAAISIAMALVAAAPRILSVLIDAIPKILTGEDGNGGIIGELTKPEHQEEFVMAAIAIATAVVQGVPKILEALLPMVPKVIEDLTGAFQSKESQDAFAAAGKALGKALIDGILYIGSITSLPNLLLGKLLKSDNWAAATQSAGDYSGASIGDYDWLAAQGYSGPTNYYIGDVSVTANSASGFAASLRAASAMGR